MIWKTLAVDKMDIEKTADLKCISRLLVEKWHVDQIKMKITVSPGGMAIVTNSVARRAKFSFSGASSLFSESPAPAVPPGAEQRKQDFFSCFNDKLLKKWPQQKNVFCFP